MIWGGGPDPDLVEDMMLTFGMTETEAEAELAGDPIRLPAELEPVIRLAGHTAGDVRVVPLGMGGARVIGSDKQAVDIAARWHGIEMTPRRARDLEIMQDEALTMMRAE